MRHPVTGEQSIPDASAIRVVIDDGGLPPIFAPPIPDHELIRLIGTGSYGEVWLARSAVGTYRAAKIVYRRSFENDQPFEREFRGIQKFEPISRSHEGLVDVLQIGRNENNAYFYYIMELADDANAAVPATAAPNLNPQVTSLTRLKTGHIQTLAQAARVVTNTATYLPRTLRAQQRRQGRLALGECISIGTTIASALEHLHKNGLVHRDIKPSNIILVKGVPKLADIGLVADTGEAKSFVGTLGFIPPEGPGTPQADVYSLGKVLYEISTGRDRHDFPQLPTDLLELPTADAMIEFNEILLKACESEPQRRYQSAAQMSVDLELLQRGKSVKRQRTLQQRWVVFRKVGISVVSLALVTAGAFFFLHAQTDRDLHSADRRVENLVAEGNDVLKKATPERLLAALDYFNKAVKLDPQFAPTYVGLFRVRLAQQFYFDHPHTDALANLRAAATNLMKMAPHLGEALIARAYLYDLDGHNREALAEAEKAAWMPPGSKEGSALVHMFYGRYLMMAGRSDEALREYQLAEQANPTDPAIKTCLGLPYHVKGNLEAALKHYQESITLEPNFFLGHYWAGRVYEEMRDFPKAISEFEKCDRLSDEYKGQAFYDDLRQACEKDGAQGYWGKRLETAPKTSPQEPYRVPAILAHLGRTNEAYRSLKEACKQGKYGLGDSQLDLCWNRNDVEFKAIAKEFLFIE
jgi:tetratricopeptide (TPR) repeat protein